MNRDVRAILLIQLGDIGDVVLSLPTVAMVHEHYPAAKIVMAVREKARDLLVDHPWIEEAFGVKQEDWPVWAKIADYWQFFSRLREYRFDLAFDLRTGTRGALMALLSGARERIGLHERGGPWWRRLCFHHLYHHEYRLGQPVASFYAGLLACHGLPVGDAAVELPVAKGRREKVKKLFWELNISPEVPLVALQPFSLWGYKEWPTDRYAQLIQRLGSGYPWTFLLTGSAQERERIDRLIKGINPPMPYVFNLAGRTEIGDLPALFQASCLFIGPDSAGLHIAAAVGTPTVGIFGPSSPASWAPRGERHAVVVKDMPCVPCRNKGCDDSGFSKCLDELTVDEVWSVVGRHLSRCRPSGYGERLGVPDRHQ
ncbi:MAG: glycosyltransferase family 9 protein [Syntrophales bacterium]|nr:glycosyltransferase family 9 protein [Syntrophales bacterium]